MTVQNTILFQNSIETLLHVISMKSVYTNFLVNTDSFYANFTNRTFQKIPIPQLTRPMCETEIPSLTVRPRDTRPQDARALTMHVFE